MSAGSIAFYNNGITGLGQVYDLFPERLSKIVVERNALLYKELDNMLTDVERQNIANVVGHENSNINQIRIDDIVKFLSNVKDDPMCTEVGIREHFKCMPEKFIQSKLEYTKKLIRTKEESLKMLYERRDCLNTREELSKLFN